MVQYFSENSAPANGNYLRKDTLRFVTADITQNTPITIKITLQKKETSATKIKVYKATKLINRQNTDVIAFIFVRRSILSAPFKAPSASFVRETQLSILTADNGFAHIFRKGQNHKAHIPLLRCAPVSRLLYFTWLILLISSILYSFTPCASRTSMAFCGS